MKKLVATGSAVTYDGKSANLYTCKGEKVYYSDGVLVGTYKTNYPSSEADIEGWNAKNKRNTILLWSGVGAGVVALAIGIFFFMRAR